MYHPRQCYDASQWFERIKDLESKWIQAKVESQAGWLKFKNQSRTQGKRPEKGQQVWLRKSDETLKDDNKLLLLWEDPFQVSGQLTETTFNLKVEPGRHQEVHRDRLKAEVPCPEGKFKPLYWTSKYLSDRKMVTGSFELEKILDYKKCLETSGTFCADGKDSVQKKTNGSQLQVLSMGIRTLSSSS